MKQSVLSLECLTSATELKAYDAVVESSRMVIRKEEAISKK